MLRAERGLAVLTAGSALVYAVHSLIRHWRYETGFDLAIFDQAVWHYSRFETPRVTVHGAPNILGDHFHPILVVLAPVYWVWSDPRALLVAQACLVAASIVPVVIFARSKLGRGPGLAIGVAYAAFWGLQSAIGFDFHEVAFAPVLIAAAILFADRRSWLPFGVSIALLLCVKEDLAILVAFFGLWLLTRRDYRAGAITLVAGIAWYELATEVVIPHYALSGEFTHWNYGELGFNLLDAVWNVLREPWRLVEVGLGNAQKRETLVWLFAPFLGLLAFTRLGILALPLVAERVLSGTSEYWGTDFHYSLTIAPVLAMGAAAGLANVAAWAARRRPEVRATVVAAGAALVVAANLAAVVAGVGQTSLARVLTPWFYDLPARAGPLGRAVDRVPPGASVAAQDFILPRLTERPEAYELQPTSGPVDYVVTGLLEPLGKPTGNASYRAQQAFVGQLMPMYVPVFYEDGWVVLRRRPPSGAGGNGVLTPMPAARARELLRLDQRYVAALFGDAGRVARCYELLPGPAPGAAACFGSADVRFRAAERALAAQLRSTVPALRGGCRELAQAARAGVSTVGRDMAAVRRAGASASRTDTRAALEVAVRDIQDRDLPGRVDRFILLCTPR